MSNVKPMADRVLIKRNKNEEVSKGGIYIPGAAQQKQIEGIVLAVGPGRLTEDGHRIEPSVKVGDRVIFEPYAGTIQQKMPGVLEDDTIIVRESEIFAVLEG